MSAFTPLLLSLWVAGLAALGALLVGVPAARLLARRRGWAADLVSTAVLLPMVLPPTVLGYALLVGVGRSSPLGGAWEALFGAPFVFSPAAAVLAAFLAALPFQLRAAQGAFEQVDPAFEEVARTLGHHELSVFARVSVPLAWRGIVGGLALAFARAIGSLAPPRWWRAASRAAPKPPASPSTTRCKAETSRAPARRPSPWPRSPA